MIEKIPGITDVEAGTLCRFPDFVMPGFLFLDEEKADKNRFVCAILTESYHLRFIY